MSVKTFCKKCGKANSRDMDACSNCGEPLRRSEEVREDAESVMTRPRGFTRVTSSSRREQIQERPQFLKCPSCGRTNRGANRFCNECGSKLEGGEAADRPSASPDADSAEMLGETESDESRPGALTMPVDRSYRDAAVFCDSCGMLNSGFEHCLNCGAELSS